MGQLTNIQMYGLISLIIILSMISILISNLKSEKKSTSVEVSKTIPQSILVGGINYTRDIEFLDKVIEDEWNRQYKYICIKGYDYINNDELDELNLKMAVNIRNRLSDYYMSTLYVYFSESGLVEYIIDRVFERTMLLGMEYQERRYRK